MVKVILFALVACGLLAASYWGAVKVKRAFWPFIVSRSGAYSGFSYPLCDDWVRTSQYVAVRDGNPLAVDVFRPAKNGQPLGEPLPVLWTHMRYQRATRLPDGNVIDIVDKTPWLATLIRHGYIAAAVDARGTGASHGVSDGPFSIQESEDAYDVTAWLASQTWCNGKVAMFGGSYRGITQYFAAGLNPPNLRAIAPEIANFDAYSTVCLGGIRSDDLLLGWSRLARDGDMSQRALPVDHDTKGEMILQAWRQQRANRYPDELFPGAPFRDSRDPRTDRLVYLDRSPSRCLESINESQIPVYHISGWFDLWVGDQLIWFANLKVPQKILIGPWPHSGGAFPYDMEHLRWFDYWLKGIDNGVVDEPPIHYFTMGAAPGQEWRSARQWPLPQEQPTAFHLSGGKSGSVNSTNDGMLSAEPPVAGSARDDYTVDYSATSGTRTRWSNVYGRPFGYGDMTLNDERGLTYTTPVLANDIEVTGHPWVSIWIETTAADIDVFAYLEEVDAQGVSTYVTEGRLRASHRATFTPLHRDLPAGVYHRSHEADVTPVPHEPFEMRFGMFPTSNLFHKGHRIRLTLTCADRDNAETVVVVPPPRMSLLRGSEFVSKIVLPIIVPEASSARNENRTT